jgi:hypothetical protein
MIILESQPQAPQMVIKRCSFKQTCLSAALKAAGRRRHRSTHVSAAEAEAEALENALNPAASLDVNMLFSMYGNAKTIEEHGGGEDEGDPEAHHDSDESTTMAVDTEMDNLAIKVQLALYGFGDGTLSGDCLVVFGKPRTSEELCVLEHIVARERGERVVDVQALRKQSLNPGISAKAGAGGKVISPFAAKI